MSDKERCIVRNEKLNRGITCKYSEERVDHMHGYTTPATYCVKYKKYYPHTCDDFDLAKIEVRKRDEE